MHLYLQTKSIKRKTKKENKHMGRPSKSEYGKFYENYIQLASGKDYATLVRQFNERITESWAAIPIEKINYAYDTDKWTIKQLFQHVIDTERIFAYRALSIARKEAQTLLPFDENEYAKNAPATHRNWKDMLTEWRIIRQSTNVLYASFTEADMAQIGTIGTNPMSVNALGFIIFGHTLHHLQIIKEKYGI
jgi:uncharacterized damage-inducible protein DinB